MSVSTFLNCQKRKPNLNVQNFTLANIKQKNNVKYFAFCNIYSCSVF